MRYIFTKITTKSLISTNKYYSNKISQVRKTEQKQRLTLKIMKVFGNDMKHKIDRKATNYSN